MESSAQQHFVDSQDLKLVVELNNEQLFSKHYTPQQLKNMTLTKLREELNIPKAFQDHFYFKLGKNEISDERNFVAWQVIQRKKVMDSEVQDDGEEEKKEGPDIEEIDLEGN